MSVRLTDEQVAWMVSYSDRDAEIPTLAREVQMWRALVNGGPCETCDGTTRRQCGFDICTPWTNDHSDHGACPDCTDGTRPGLIARLEAIDAELAGYEPVWTVRSIIDDLRRAVSS